MTIHRAQLHRAISDSTVDSALRSLRAFLKAGWSHPNRIVLDLETVEWAEFGAAARLIAFTEGLARHGFSVLIRPPNPSRRLDEERFLARSAERMNAVTRMGVAGDLGRRVLARRACLSFLQYIGFLDAIQCKHLPPEVSGLITMGDTKQAIGGHPVRGFPTHVPFSWIAMEGTKNGGWQKRAIDFFYGQGVVMTYSDAESLVTTVLGHLVDNVVDHAPEEGVPSTSALFGAVALNRSGAHYRPRLQMFYDSVGTYIDWLARQNSPIVRVVVADSGLGLVNSLLPKFREIHKRSRTKGIGGTAEESVACTAFAFEPTASRHEPGLRRGVGLTTVRRFVRSYRGLIMVRASNTSTGFECRNGSPELLSEVRLPYAPGTSVEVFLGLTLRARRRLEKTGRVASEPVDLVVVAESMHRERSGLFPRLHEAIENAGAKLPVVILQIYDWQRDRNLVDGFAAELASAAKELYGSSGLIVVVEGASEADCSATFKALDELRESQDHEGSSGELWVPPFLVVGANGRPNWTGASGPLREIMYRLLEGKWIDVDKISASLASRDKEYLQTERDWLMVDKDGQVGLRVGIEEVEAALASHLRKNLDRQLERLVRSDSHGS